MSSPIRKAVIRRIAENKRVSLAVAAHIYDCKPIKVKQDLCQQEEKRRALSDTSHTRNSQGELDG